MRMWFPPVPGKPLPFSASQTTLVFTAAAKWTETREVSNTYSKGEIKFKSAMTNSRVLSDKTHNKILLGTYTKRWYSSVLSSQPLWINLNKRQQEIGLVVCVFILHEWRSCGTKQSPYFLFFYCVKLLRPKPAAHRILIASRPFLILREQDRSRKI